MDKMPEKSSSDLRELVYRGVESDELDYKAALNWTDMSRAARAKIVRHCIALANTKGGYIVVGVGEGLRSSVGLPGVDARTGARFRSFHGRAVHQPLRRAADRLHHRAAGDRR